MKNMCPTLPCMPHFTPNALLYPTGHNSTDLFHFTTHVPLYPTCPNLPHMFHFTPYVPLYPIFRMANMCPTLPQMSYLFPQITLHLHLLHFTPGASIKFRFLRHLVVQPQVQLQLLKGAIKKVINLVTSKSDHQDFTFH